MSGQRISVVLDEPGERLDKALSNALPNFSRSQCQRLIKEGNVTIDGEAAQSSRRLIGGEQVQVFIPDAEPVDLVPESIPLDIRYEDSDLIVVNKPAGMVVHPAAGHEHGTLVHAVLAHYPDLPGIGGEKRPGIVHRLDKDTSGLILIAKNEAALRYAQQQFKERSIKKIYLALADGQLSRREMMIDAPIGRDLSDRKRMAVIAPGTSAHSRSAQTKIKVISTSDHFSLVECQPLTGRTHQIRVHLAFAGHPIVGDSIYGRRKQQLALERQFLHASELTFRRPDDGSTVTVKAELPEELQVY